MFCDVYLRIPHLPDGYENSSNSSFFLKPLISNVDNNLKAILK